MQEGKRHIVWDVLVQRFTFEDLGRRSHWSLKSSLDQCVLCCTNDSRIVIQNNFHRHVSEQGTHAAFVEKRVHEYWVLHAGNDLSRDIAADEDAAGCHEVQRTVTCLRSIDTDENVQRLIANCGVVLK